MNNILINIVTSFKNDENAALYIFDQQLAQAIFFSFAVGVINNDEIDEEKIITLNNAIVWLREHESLIKKIQKEILLGDNSHE